METKNLTKSYFEKELKDMVVNCIGLKPNTAQKKASDILKKYDDIIAYSVSHKEFYKKEYEKLEIKFNTLKSGVIEYAVGEYEGRLLLKDIEQIESGKKDVLLTTKTGRKITMSSDFSYIKDLL